MASSDSGATYEASLTSIGIFPQHPTDWGDPPARPVVWAKSQQLRSQKIKARDNIKFSWDWAKALPTDGDKTEFKVENTCQQLFWLEHEIQSMVTFKTIDVEDANNTLFQETRAGQEFPSCFELNLTIINDVRSLFYKKNGATLQITFKDEFVYGYTYFTSQTFQVQIICPTLENFSGFDLKQKQNGPQQDEVDDGNKTKPQEIAVHNSSIHPKNFYHKKWTHQQSTGLIQDQHDTQDFTFVQCLFKIVNPIDQPVVVYAEKFLQSLCGDIQLGLKGFNPSRVRKETTSISIMSTKYRDQRDTKRNKTASALSKSKDSNKIQAKSTVANKDERQLFQNISFKKRNLEKPYNHGAKTRRRLCSNTPQTPCVGDASFQNQIKVGAFAKQSDIADLFGNLQNQAASGCDGDFYGLNNENNVITHICSSPDNFWRVKLASTLTINTILFIENQFTYADPEFESVWLLTYQITIGDNPDSFQNSVCVSAGTITKGGWFPCGGTGQYLSITSTTQRVGFSEIMAYTQYAIQMNALSPPVCTFCTAANPALRALLQEVTLKQDSSTLVKTGLTDPNPTITFYLKAKIQIRAVVLLGARQTDLHPYQTNTDISVKNFNDVEQSCFQIADYNTYTESDCSNFSGNTVIVQRQGLGLIIAGFGILSDCNCAQTSFDPSQFTAPPFVDSFASGTLLSTIAGGVAVSVTFNLNIPDTVSSVCGNVDGLTYCGSRSPTTLTDLTSNVVMSTYPYRKVTWSSTSTTGTLTLQNTVDADVGSWQIEVKVSLAANPAVFRTQVITVSTTAQGAPLCAIAIGSQNLLNTSVTAQQSANNPGFNTNPSIGCNGMLQNTAPSQLVSTSADLSSIHYWSVFFPQNVVINTLLVIGPEVPDLSNLPKTTVSFGSSTNFKTNPICLIEGQLTDGGWYPCSGSGNYLALWSNTNGVTFYEIMAYAGFAIQWNSMSQTWQNVQADSNYPAANVLSKIVVMNDSDATRQKCIASLAGTSSTGSFQLRFKAQHTIKAVTLVPGRNPAWQNNQKDVTVQVTDITQTVQTCGIIADYNTYSEQVCSKPGNLVTLTRSAASVQLSFCSVGVFSDCNCANTSFDQAQISPFPNLSTILETSSVDVTIGQTRSIAVTQQISDTISSICGNADGLSFCGDRVVSFTDAATNKAITQMPYKDLLYFDGNLILNPTTAQTTKIKVTVSLVSYPKVSRTEVFTVIVNQASGTESIPDQQLFAIVGQLCSLSLPATRSPSTFFILSKQAFTVEVKGNLLNVRSNKNADRGKSFNVKMSSVFYDPNLPTIFFKVTVKFAEDPVPSLPIQSNDQPKKKTKKKDTKPQPSTDETNSTNQTETSSSQVDFSQMKCTTDDDGNLLICTSLANSKYTCQLDETGEMVCGTNLQIKKPEFIPNQPSMVISEINKYGVFYFTFSEEMNFSSLINLDCGGFIDGVLSEKTDIKSAKYQKPVFTSDADCSVSNTTSGKGGGRSQKYREKARAATEGYFNRNKYLLNHTHLNITLISGGDQDDSKQQFEWLVLNITQTQIKIQVIFKDPVYISTDARNPDQLAISLLSGSLPVFKTKQTRQNINNPLRIEPKQVPSQLKLDSKMTGIAGAVANSLDTVNMGAVIGTYSMSISLNYIMSKMYTMINALQMTMATFRLNVAIPSNVYIFTQKVNDLASFNLLPTDQIFAYFFKWSDTSLPNTGFQAMGTQSTRLTPYLGSIFIAMVLICAISLFYGITYPCRKLETVLSRIHKKMKASYYWRGIIRLMLEAFFDLSTGIMLSINDPRYETASDIFDFVLTCLFAIVVIAAPLSAYLLLRKYDSQLDQEEFQAKYGSLTEGYYTTGALGKIKTRQVVVWFIVRRIATALVIVQMGDLTPWLLITANMYLALADAIINWFYSPYESQMDGIVASLNNFLVLILSYFPYLYAGLISDPEVRYQAGWIQASLLGVMLVFNLFVCGYTIFFETIKEIRRVRIERHNLKVLRRLGYKAVVVGMAPWQIMARFCQLDWLCFDEVPRINVQIANQVGEYQRWLSIQTEMLNRNVNARLQDVLNQEVRQIQIKIRNNQVISNKLTEQQQLGRANQESRVKFGKKKKLIVEESQLVQDGAHYNDLSFGDIEIKSEQLGSFENDNFSQKSLERQFSAIRKFSLSLEELELAEIQARNQRSKKFIQDLLQKQKPRSSVRVIFE